MPESKIIVTFTTFGVRKAHLNAVLNSMYNQTIKPHEIRCYTELTVDDFPEHTRKLFDKCNVKVHPADGSYKGYKKLLWALKDTWKAENVILVTIDDDWIYSPTLIQRLLQLHNKYPNAVVCDRGRRIRPKQGYNRWPYWKGTISKPHETMIFSGSGCLFRPTMFNESVFDMKDIKESCPTADDLWWTIQCIMAGTPVLTLSGRGHNPKEMVHIPNDIKLYKTHNQAKNTIQWEKLLKYAKSKYGIDIYAKIT